MTDSVFGIDFGTTNSCLAVMEEGVPRIVEIEGEPIVPSVVSFDRASGEVIVGRRALNRLVLEPRDTVRSIKRKMGESEPLEVAGRSLLPEEIAAEILGHLKRQGEAALGRSIVRAVITVPAYFEDAQRRATIRAGELAGLEVTRIINEPTAAALVYGRLGTRGLGGEQVGTRASAEDSELVLVYDLGGGTFDVSVMKLTGELCEVLSSCGDNHLGGDDFDEMVAEKLLDRACESAGARLATPPQTQARLREAAEQAKIDLSSKPYIRIMEEALFDRRHLDTELARSDFETWIEPRLEESFRQVEAALEEAEMKAEGIDRVILVGGSTAIPRIRQRLEERFEAPVEHAVDPALCVALGAAVQGAILAGDVFDQILVDVAAHSMGIKTVSHEQLMSAEKADQFSCLIRRNSQIPAIFSEVFRTVVHHQEKVEVDVYQGESSKCSGNTLIGKFDFDLEPSPADSPIVVELGYDLDGLVRVVAEQKGYGNRREVTLDSRRYAPARMDDEGETGAAIDNYMIRKARKLAGTIGEPELRRHLESVATDYEKALGDSTEDAEVDRLEDLLLDLLEEAEQKLED